jgi:hypothetical protein
MEKVKSQSMSLGKDPCSPFYIPRGARYMSGERVREGELLHAQQVCVRSQTSGPGNECL